MRFMLLAIVAATAFGVYKTWNTETSEDLRAWAYNTVFEDKSSRQALRRVSDRLSSSWLDSSDTVTTSTSAPTWSSSDPAPPQYLLPTNPMPPHQVQQVPSRRRVFQRRPGLLIPLDGR